jgi:hypothetical protein
LPLTGRADSQARIGNSAGRAYWADWNINPRDILFLNTHGGAGLANFASVLGHNRLLKYLRDEIGEGPLEEFQRRFSAKVKPRMDAGDLHVFNFYEEKPYKKFRVVNSESARRGFDFLSSHPVPANHVWMVKFTRPQNAIYVKLCRMMNTWLVDDIQSIAADDQGIDSVLQGDLPKNLSPELLRNLLLVLLGAGLITLGLYVWGIWH